MPIFLHKVELIWKLKARKIIGKRARQQPRQGTPQYAIARLPAVKKLLTLILVVSMLCFVKGEREFPTL